MKKRDIRDYLQDIADAVKDIEDFTENQSYAQFVKDKKTLGKATHKTEWQFVSGLLQEEYSPYRRSVALIKLESNRFL